MRRTLFIFLFAGIGFAQKYHPAVQYIFPLPGSDKIPQLATVILRLQPEYLSEITDLDNLITVEGDKVYEGETFFATDDATIIFRPDTRLRRDDVVHVTVAADQFGKSPFEYDFTVVSSEQTASPAPVAVVENHGINPKKNAHIRVINGIAVPGDFPVLSIMKSGQTAPGKIFFGSHFVNPGYGNYLIICDNTGTPCFYRRYDRAMSSGNFMLQPTGVLSAFLRTPTEYIVLDGNYEEIDVYQCGHGYATDSHEFQLLENGHALMIAEEYLHIDMSQVVENGQKDALVLGSHVQELDGNKNVIFEWRSWDHFRIEDAVYEDLTSSRIDYVHLNSIAEDYDGHLVVSSRHQSSVTKINRQTGELIWQVGGEQNQFDFINDEWMLSHQHDARPVPGKPDCYTIFDNGNHRKPEFSRVIEIKVIPNRKRVHKLWEYRFQPDHYSYMMGSAQRLDNGNTFIDFSTKAPVMACEVTPGGVTVFELQGNGCSTYRTRRYPWNGKAKTPYLLVENLGYVINLIFNKFGDETVQHYNIYYGTTENPTRLLAQTENTWFQAFGLKNKTRFFFRVAAVHHDGRESGFSNQEKVFIDYVEPGINMVENGEFENDTGWTLLTSGNANASGSIDAENRYHIHIDHAGNLPEHIQLVQENCILLQGQEYLFEFDACAGTNRVLEAVVENKKTCLNYGQTSPTYIKKKMARYSCSFVMTRPSDANAQIAFKCGRTQADVYIDNVSLTQVNNMAVPSKTQTSGPQKSVLYANYPNPFNAATEIKYMLPKAARVQLEVFNPLGRKVAVLVDGKQPAGEHRVRFPAGHLVSGVYFYRLTVGGFSQVRKLLLIK